MRQKSRYRRLLTDRRVHVALVVAIFFVPFAAPRISSFVVTVSECILSGQLPSSPPKCDYTLSGTLGIVGYCKHEDSHLELEVGLLWSNELDQDYRYSKYYLTVDPDLAFLDCQSSKSYYFDRSMLQVKNFGGDYRTGYDTGTKFGELKPDKWRRKNEFGEQVCQQLREHTELVREITSTKTTESESE